MTSFSHSHPSLRFFQPPLGLCVVTLTLPSDWFRTQPTNQSNQVVDRRQSVLRYQPKRHNRKQKRYQMFFSFSLYFNKIHTFRWRRDLLKISR